MDKRKYMSCSGIEDNKPLSIMRDEIEVVKFRNRAN